MVVNNLGQEYGQSFGGVGMSSGGRLSKGVCQVGGVILRYVILPIFCACEKMAGNPTDLMNLYCCVCFIQVEGCFQDLTSLRDYHVRYKICEQHLKAPNILRVRGINPGG